MTSEASVKALAASLGFVACGIARLEPSSRAAELDAWLSRGYAGTMRYLHRQAKRRKDPRTIVPGATTAVVVLDNYYTPDSPEDTEPPKVAKYARGEDYHRVTQRRLERLAEHLLANGATVARAYADAGPVPERELAALAGLGWIGKNTMLIRPGMGSYCFIGSVLTDLELAPDPPFQLDRCGSCTRCLDACPTGAIVEPHVLDATRCISYLTIEQKGPIPDDLVDRIDGWAFGCDICNDVCPWNERFAVPTGVAEFAPRGDLAELRRDPEHFERLAPEEFERRYGGTPFERPGLLGMRRNTRAARRASKNRV